MCSGSFARDETRVTITILVTTTVIYGGMLELMME